MALGTGTTHFIDLYLRMIGLNEVPRQFHLWACLSMLGSCVGHRVWVKKDVASVVYPNLYVMLVGPSGSGKEQAIKTVLKLVSEQPVVNTYPGKLTGPGMWEYLSKSGEMEVEGRGKHRTVTTRNACVYFVTEELGMCVRAGDLGHDLITTMTGLYVDPPMVIDGTRQHGFVRLIHPCVNWLAGTTDEWLLRSVPRDAVEGGFVARVQIVRGNRNYAVRYPRMLYPPDYQEIYTYLKQRIDDLLLLEDAEFVLDEQALRVHDEWYINEKPPDESGLLPAFNRADDLIYKLALLLALAEWTGRDTLNDAGEIVYDCTIHAQHVTEAIELWRSLVYDMPETIKVASATPQTTDVEVVRRVIEKAETITRSALMQRVGSKCIVKERLDKALDTLFAEEVVKEHSEQGRGTRPKVWYTWEGGSNENELDGNRSRMGVGGDVCAGVSVGEIG